MGVWLRDGTRVDEDVFEIAVESYVNETYSREEYSSWTKTREKIWSGG